MHCPGGQAGHNDSAGAGEGFKGRAGRREGAGL